MVESRVFTFEEKGKSSGNEERGLEAERNVTLMSILNMSRIGPYVSVENIWENFNKLTSTSSREVREDVARDCRDRVHLIKESGNDSIAHLAISRNTLNSILRINDIAEMKIDKIDNLKIAIEKGVVISPNDLTGQIRVSPVVLMDLKRGLAEFDNLVEQQKASNP